MSVAEGRKEGGEAAVAANYLPTDPLLNPTPCANRVTLK